MTSALTRLWVPLAFVVSIVGALACGRDGQVVQATGIISLAPNTTDILRDLGVADQIVGVTRYDDSTAKELKVPSVGGILDPSVEQIVGLGPRLVLGHWDGAEPHWKAQIEQAGIEVHLCKIVEIDDLKTCVQDIARLTQATEAGVDVLKKMAPLFEQPPDLKNAPTVLLVLNHEPLIVASRDSFPAQIARLAGFSTLPSGAGPSYPKLSLEAVATLQPTLALDLVHGTRADTSAWQDKVRTAHPTLRFGVMAPELLLQPGPKLVHGLNALRRLRAPMGTER